ncbi:hypothetical protein AOP6_3000 [Desulfuromonas sp. AOP6]|nr:hypothetical protein AOP6_3000 [Desulfuromonas sp. AOP6]
MLVRENGIVFRTKYFIVYQASNDKKLKRLGITASRKIGNAVLRNHIKRLIRQFFRLNFDKLPASVDISIICKRGAASLTYAQVSSELSFLVKGNENK